jgi:signal transduction histidine kinase
MRLKGWVKLSSDKLLSAASAIEPGLLPVFRTVIGLQVALLLLALSQMLFEPVRPERYWVPLINFLGLTPLLGYLCWSRLQRWLGRTYLPAALIYVTIFTLLEYTFAIRDFLQGTRDARFELFLNGSGWLLLVRLLLPLVLTAWQYGLRAVITFVVGVMGYELFTFWLMESLARPLIGLALSRALIFALVGVIVTRIMAGQRQQRQELAAANRQLADHAATLEQLTISRERNRLARELHDTLAHTLSAVSVQLEAVDSVWELNPNKARELLNKSLAQTRSGLTETRRALQALRASPLEDLGLALAVRTLAESTARRGDLQLDLAVNGESDHLSADQEQQIYRIAQEAMDNVLKHAQAHKLRVELSAVNGHTILTVADDGAGFEADAPHIKGHFGLGGIQERAEAAEGSLHIESKVGVGTTVRLVV